MMSYKYKDEILADIGPEPNCNYDFEKEEYYKKIDELNHVYAQAAEYKEYRADTEKLYNALKAKGEKEILKYKTIAEEYEAKAKAWDVMKKDFEGIADTPIGQQMLFNMSMIMERVESGGSE